MASLEEKLLAEKQHCYCSSSEDSEMAENSDDDEEKEKQTSVESEAQTPDVHHKWEGTSMNTGPKGVISDWQRFKQLETEKRTEDERERKELYQKLSMTVRSSLEEESDKAQLDDPEMAELLDDKFLLEYRKQRMQEMLEQNKQQQTNKSFGQLIYLKNTQAYLDAVDKEDRKVKVIVHINEDRIEACKAMNAALQQLSKVYSNDKFCSIDVSRIGMSRDFKANGVPALLIYKGGQIIGNFVQLANELGNDFDSEDVQRYLIEHGMLDDRTLKPIIAHRVARNDDSDSD